MPELKLIYRFLRKVSDWTVAGYYSDVYIEGEENVPKDGPLIIASTHHNEMIDIATLAATIPHRRHLSFWAKSTMFANPIAAEIMSSTGAIPVKRNLNAGGNATSNASISPKNASIHNPNPNANSTTNTNASPTPSRTSLFSSTSHTLANGGVIGVFPEGTSYTQARIVQVMSGAGWAGVEYLKLWRERQHRKGRDGTRGASGLRIVPVSVVYTDKARYRSKIVVRYGAPILMDDYFDHLFRDIEDSENGSDSDSETDERSKDIVKKVTKRVEEALLGMTINAGDWDTICATSMARTILWGSEEGAPLKNWVEVSQRLVKELEVSPNPETTHLHKALSKYYALLHHSKTKHSILTSLVPLSSSTPRTAALILKSTLSLLKHTIPTLPFTILFVPSFILFLPGYISGSLASRFLAVRGEEESPAQFKAVGGGLGVGAGLGIGLGLAKLNNWPSGNVMSGLLKSVVENAKELSPSWIGAFIGDVIGKFKGTVVERIGSLGIESLVHLLAQIERTGGRWAKSSAVLLAIWANVFFLSRWHSMLIDVNYRMIQRLITYTKLISAFASSSPSNPTANSIIEKYSLPPLPALNPYIKRSLAASSSSSTSPSPFNSTIITPSTSTSLSNSLSSSSASIATTSSTTTLPSLPAPPTPLPVASSSSSLSRPNPRPPTSREQKVLMRHLLVARAEACLALKKHFQLGGNGNGTQSWAELRGAGAKVPKI